MAITTSDILGSDQVGIYLAVCGNVVFHAHELNEEGLARIDQYIGCLLYTSPSPRDATLSRMPSSA